LVTSFSSCIPFLLSLIESFIHRSLQFKL
jgi:hypothetical protein